MRTRPQLILDTKTLTPYFGINVFHQGRWIAAGDDDGQFRFETEAERDAKRKELRDLRIPVQAKERKG